MTPVVVKNLLSPSNPQRKTLSPRDPHDPIPMSLSASQKAAIEQKRQAALALQASKKDISQQAKVVTSSNTNKSYTLDTGGHVSLDDESLRIEMEDFDRIADEIKNVNETPAVDPNQYIEKPYSSKKTNAYNGTGIPKSELLSSLESLPPPSPDLESFMDLHDGKLIPQTLASQTFLVPLSSLKTLSYVTQITSSSLKSNLKLYAVRGVAELSLRSWKSLERLEEERGRREVKRLKGIREGILGKKKRGGEEGGGKFSFKVRLGASARSEAMSINE